MNMLFSLVGCQYCSIAKMAVLQANLSLPLNQKIKIIDVLPQEINGRWIGDSRLAFLAKLNKTESLSEWGFPVLVIESVGVQKRFESYIQGRTGRVVVHSAYSENHYVTFLKEFFGTT